MTASRLDAAHVTPLHGRVGDAMLRGNATLSLVGIRLSRVLEAPRADDGYRVLVDRLWPRGRTKAISPSMPG